MQSGKKRVPKKKKPSPKSRITLRQGKGPKNNNVVRAKVPSAQPQQSGWQKFLQGLKKALGIGAKIASFVVPLLGQQSASGHCALMKSCTSGQAKTVPLEQMVGVAHPVQMQGTGRPIITTHKNHYKFIHQDVIGAVSIKAGTKRGDLLFRMEISPKMAKWLSKVGQFTKYRFVHCFLSYVPTSASIEEGAIILLPEWDVDSPVLGGNGEDTVKQAMAHEAALMTSVWRPAVTHFSNADEPEEYYFVDDMSYEKRLSVQGLFSIYAASDFDKDLEAGQLQITYEVDFDVPDVGNLTDGFWQLLYSSEENATHQQPLGDNPRVGVIVYQDPLAGSLEVPQNLRISYHTTGGSPNEWGIELPYGYWIVWWATRSLEEPVTNAAAAYGAYSLLGSDDGSFVPYTFTSKTLGGDAVWRATGWSLVYSSGQSNVPINELPKSYWTYTMGGPGSGEAFMRLGATRLHGYPPATYSSSTLGCALKEFLLTLKRESNKKDKQAQKLVRSLKSIGELH